MAGPIIRRSLLLLLAASASLLVACGSGGGGSSDPLPPLPPVPVAPSITTQPSAVAVLIGQPATFTVSAAGTSPQYQWRRNGTAIAGATSATYTLAAAALGDNGAQFSVVVSNLVGSATSAAAALTVTDPVVAPSLVRAPATVSVVAGQTATFDVVAGGTAPLAYQWFRGGMIIPGAVQASYSLVTTLSDNNAEFSVRVTNSAGTITSPVAPLRVSAQFVPVSISSEPADASIRVGEQAGFSVLLQGTGPFTVQWLRGGTEIVATLAGTSALQHVYIFAGPAALTDNGALFSLRVTDAAGNAVTSRQARLTVSP